MNGLSLAEVARRLGVQPPSLYKYFPSLMAIYDALFLEGQRENLEAMRAGMQGAEPGLDALTRGPRSERAVVSGQPRGRRAALLAPGPELPSLTGGVRRQHGDGGAPARRPRGRGGQGPARPGANEEGAIYLVSTLIVGVLSQAFANEPDLPWGEGRFTPMFTTLMRLLPAAFPPTIE